MPPSCGRCVGRSPAADLTTPSCRTTPVPTALHHRTPTPFTPCASLHLTRRYFCHFSPRAALQRHSTAHCTRDRTDGRGTGGQAPLRAPLLPALLRTRHYYTSRAFHRTCLFAYAALTPHTLPQGCMDVWRARGMARQAWRRPPRFTPHTSYATPALLPASSAASTSLIALRTLPPLSLPLHRGTHRGGHTWARLRCARAYPASSRVRGLLYWCAGSRGSLHYFVPAHTFARLLTLVSC